MGFHEDDRIRRKNASYTCEGITDNGVYLKLNSIPVRDMVELLTKSGYRVELKPDHIISINRKYTGGEKANHDNKPPSTIQSPVVLYPSKSRDEDK